MPSARDADRKMAARVAATAARVVQVNNRCVGATKAGDDELQEDAAFLARHLSPLAWERFLRCLDKAKEQGAIEQSFFQQRQHGSHRV